VFCHREGIPPQDEFMSPEEIERIVRILKSLGVRYIKLTGGEPLLRNDITDIISRIRSTGVDEISMTTNGTRLDVLAYKLREAGLDRINISIHSLKRWKFYLITGVDMLDTVKKGIEESIDSGLYPVKLNFVVLKGLNDDEVLDLIEYSRKLGGGDTNIVQFIELININPAYYNAYHMSLDPIEDDVRKKAVSFRKRRLHNRPQYTLDNGVIIEFVKPMYNPSFCMGNDRIRITHDGKFKPCLLRNDNHVDFLYLLRNGASDDEIIERFLEAVLRREPFFKRDYDASFDIGSHIDYSVCPI
jgi:cyclic pyranopterin phosphate synthase